MIRKLSTENEYSRQEPETQLPPFADHYFADHAIVRNGLVNHGFKNVELVIVLLIPVIEIEE